MELRPGYKPTEVGVIPVDWRASRLDDEADLLTGFPFPSSGFTKVGLRLLRGSNVKRGAVDWSPEITQCWPGISAKTQAYQLRADDLVIAMDGALVGRSFATIALSDLPALLVQRVARVRSKKTVQGLLRAWVGSEFFVRHVDLVKTHTAIPHISPRDIRDFAIAVPGDTAEQQAIATAISDIDALLSGLDRLIAKKRDLKQAAIQQLLTGQARLPGFHGEWETQPMASVVADLEAGVSVNSVAGVSNSGSGEPGILKTSCIADGAFDPTESKLIDPRDMGRAKLNPRRNTLIISRMNTPNLVGEVGFVEQDYPNLYLPDRLWMTRFRSESDLCPKWLAYTLSSPAVKQAIKDLASGTSGSMKNIAKGKLLALPLAFPAAREQEAIATILSDMDAELTALEARRDKTRAIKQGMMQELLTGRTRLV